MGHVLMENRNGLVVDSRLTLATGTAEREAAISMAAEIPGDRRVTFGCGQGVRRQGFRQGSAGIDCHPTCCAASQGLGNRRSNYPAPRVCGQSAKTQAGGRDFRLDENGWLVAEGQIQGRRENRPAVYALRRRIQPGAHAKSWVARSSLRRTLSSFDGVSPEMKRNASKYGKTAHRVGAKFQRTNGNSSLTEIIPSVKTLFQHPASPFFGGGICTNLITFAA